MSLYACRITILNLLVRASHLGLFLWLGNRFGTSELSDDVFLLQAPLVVLMTVSASTAEIIVMPALHRAERTNATLAMRNLLRRKALIVVLPISLLCILGSSYLTGYRNFYVLGLLAAMPPLAALSAISGGILNARGLHVRAVLGPAYGSSVGAALLALTTPSAVSLAVVLFGFELGRFLGLQFHTRNLFPPKIGARDLTLELRNWSIRGGLKQMSASFLGALNPLVDILFANHLTEGSVTQIEYAARLWNLVPLLFAGHLTLLHARISRSASRGELASGQVHRAGRQVGGVACMISLVAIAACPWGIDLLYGFGNMDTSARQVLSGVLMAYLLGAWVFLIGAVYVRALTVDGHIDVIARVAAVSVLVNISLNTLLVPVAGIFGIGLATSITYTLNTALLVWFYGRRTVRAT